MTLTSVKFPFYTIPIQDFLTSSCNTIPIYKTGVTVKIPGLLGMNDKHSLVHLWQGLFKKCNKVKAVT